MPRANVQAIKAALIYLLAAMVLVIIPVAAAAAPVGEPVAPSAVPDEGEVEPQWVPSNAHPGFYAARDNRNLDPNEYGLVGSHQSFYWDKLEPQEGQYDWSSIYAFINRATGSGKRVALQIITFNSRANQYNTSDPPIRVPAWVFAAGAGKVTAPDGFQIPRYWDPIYKAKYRNFVTALGNEFDGHPDIEYIQLGVGKFGETQPCDDIDDQYVRAALVADGWTEWTWPYIVNEIVDMYDAAFDQTKLVLASAPTFLGETMRRDWVDHAISVGVGLFPAGLMADLDWVDLRTKSGWNGVGKYDRILDNIETVPWVPVSFEMYEYMTPDSTRFFWGVAAGLSRRADYITLERDVLYEGLPNDPVVTPLTEHIETVRWAGKYIGKRMNNTPSVWVLLRETGIVYTLFPQKGNYSFGLVQDDAITGGRTKPTTYRTRLQLVQNGSLNAGTRIPDPDTESNWDVETDQAFLQAPRSGYDPGMPPWEGWIARRTDQPSNPNMFFKVDDRYIYGGTNQVTVSVIYLDRGTDSWRLVYDAVGDANKVAGTVVKTNSGTWRKKVFEINDARFSNSQTGAADLRIECMGDGNEYIQMVDVRRGSGTPPETFNVPLSSSPDGWNLVSVPLVPSSTNIADFLSSIAGKYDIVQAYYAGGWHKYPGGDLTTVDHKMGLWIHVTQNCTLTVTGQPPTTTTISLSAAGDGWNLIGWPSASSRSIATALAGIAGKYTQVYAYTPGDPSDPWKLYDPNAPSFVSDLQQLSPGKGFWIHMTTNGDLVVGF